MSIKFDANGNIDPSSLEKDLQQALDSDVKYKQTDNMKKRAIKVAGSYDEFKNMVACAHLKKVSSQDIESLKEVKRGWKKQSVSQASSSLLRDERDTPPAISVPLVPGAEKRKLPKTFTEFHKIWRRTENKDLKYRYLNEVGRARVTKLLNSECDVEVLEDIIAVILEQASHGAASEDIYNTTCILGWFGALVGLKGFSFNARFFGSELKNGVCRFLEECGEDAAVSLCSDFRSA